MCSTSLSINHIHKSFCSVLTNKLENCLKARMDKVTFVTIERADRLEETVKTS